MEWAWCWFGGFAKSLGPERGGGYRSWLHIFLPILAKITLNSVVARFLSFPFFNIVYFVFFFSSSVARYHCQRAFPPTTNKYPARSRLEWQPWPYGMRNEDGRVECSITWPDWLANVSLSGRDKKTRNVVVLRYVQPWCSGMRVFGAVIPQCMPHRQRYHIVTPGRLSNSDFKSVIKVTHITQHR